MTIPHGVSGVLGRIAGIEAHFASASAATQPTAPPPVEGFEPFGEIYQRAVTTRPAAALATASSAAPVPVAGGADPIRTVAPTPVGDLAVEVSAAIQGLAGAPGVRPVGGYGAMRVPAELRAYGNGRIPPAALSKVNQPGSNHRLHAPAAASWNGLVAEAGRAGFDLRITDSYRDYDEQVDLVRRKGLYSQGGYAATPGTSNHGWGLAVDADVRDPDLRRWLQVNAPRFGWVEAVPREPWHWEFRPDQV